MMLRCYFLLFLALATTVTSFAPSNGIVQQSRRIVGILRNKADNMTEEEYDAAIDKATGAMSKFTSTYLKRSETTLCTDKTVAAAVVKGLAKHKVELGAPLCPCRFYEDKEAEVKKGYWNCPCVPMRDDKICQCCLFLTPDHPFAGEDQDISKEEVLELANKIKKD